MTVLSLIPVAAGDSLLPAGSDKLIHLVMYAGLATVFFSAYPNADRRGLVVGLLCYGGLIELAQSITPWRSGSLGDLIANGLGLYLVWLRDKLK